MRPTEHPVISIADFYDSHEFRFAAKNLGYSSDFRSGLWLRSLERLFVLEQYVRFIGRSTFYHAELDQLLFRNDLLLEGLDAVRPWGLCFPWHNSERAVASVFYGRGLEGLQSLLDFARHSPGFRSEMHLLAEWAVHYPELVSALPTLSSVVAPTSGPKVPRIPTLPVEVLGGVVDAAQVGQWLGGVDPRNVPLTQIPRTKFVDPPEPGLLTRDDLEDFTFTYDEQLRDLKCRSSNGTTTRIYNLHLHSKVHNWLAMSDETLTRLIDGSNQAGGRRLPGTRRVQVISRTRESASKLLSNPRRGLVIASQKVNKTVRRRPSSKPYISGDSFRANATHVWEAAQRNLRAQSLHRGDLVFCQSDLLEEFAEHALAIGAPPLVVMAGNSDRNFDSDPIRELRAKLGLTIFAQNLRSPLDGYSHLPIGLENRWLANHGSTRAMARDRNRPVPRRSRVLSAFSPVTNPAIRLPSVRSLRNAKTVDEPGVVSPRTHRKLLRSFMFVASPPGNGEDTHRTWEAMYLGCVPVVLNSYLTRELDRLGLPVWVVNSYNDLEQFTETMLAEKYESLEGRFGAEALWLGFWSAKVNDARKAILAGL
jgi:hypothetical protein